MNVRENCKKPFGITPASMTLWGPDEEYNAKAEEKYLTWLIDNGATSISICGSTGENKAMNMDEQKKIIEHISGFLGGQVPLIIGTGFYNTINTIRMSKFADEHGADGVMVILPYYFSPHKKAVLRHYRDLRKEVSCRIMIYNNPWFAGYELEVPEVQELVEDGTIQDIKAAHGDPNRVHELKFHMGDKINVMYGHDYCAAEGLLAGADGWLSGFPAILPKQCRAIWDAAQAKDVDATFAAQNNIQPYIDYFFHDKKNGVPHWLEICHYTLIAQGIDGGLPRRPLGDLADEDKKKIEKLLADMD
ncbi:dihydrodipicolinate synthase family protein [Hornefia butyriciproducens]|uniref:dihydrodipicolinate synthase family protein n=1 Tax=Hornefia butyriciproducens TaxID=2652293 RepID=UPI003F889306